MRRVAEEVIDRLQGVKNTGQTSIVGGRKRRILVRLDVEKLAGYNLSPLDIKNALQGANITLPVGAFE